MVPSPFAGQDPSPDDWNLAQRGGAGHGVGIHAILTAMAACRAGIASAWRSRPTASHRTTRGIRSGCVRMGATALASSYVEVRTGTLGSSLSEWRGRLGTSLSAPEI